MGKPAMLSSIAHLVPVAGVLSAVALSGQAHAATLNELAALQIVTNVPFERQIDAVRQLGVRRVRLALRWYEIERVRGSYDWRAADVRLRTVQRAGMVPIVTLYGGHGSYGRAAGVPGATPSTPDAFDGFARFAAEAARRYGAGTSDMPILYEIWNEPNTKTFWGRGPEPETYAELASRACAAIRVAVPTARVLALAMEGTPVKPPYVVKAYGLDIYGEWARRAASPGLMACVDGISMHPYLGPPELHHRYEPALQRFMADRWAKPAQPIIANTEVGYSAASGGRTVAAQAALVLRALLVGAAPGRITNLYQAVDGGSNPAKPDETFGLFTYAGAIKPAGAALKRLLGEIGDYEIDGLTLDDAGIYRFRAHRGNARAEVLWTLKATARAAVDAGSGLDLVTGGPREADGGAMAIDAVPLLVLRP